MWPSSCFKPAAKTLGGGVLPGKLAGALGLIAFAGLHGLQLKAGVAEIPKDIHSPASVGIDSAYATANAMVTYTQAYLGLKVLGTGQESAVPVTPEGIAVGMSAGENNPRSKPELRPPSALELAVTIGGQAIFIANS